MNLADGLSGISNTVLLGACIKKEPTRAWSVSFCFEADALGKPVIKDLDSEDTVSLDLGVRNFIHDSDRHSAGRLNLSDGRERLECEQHSLSRKREGSNNWVPQSRRVVQVHARMSNKKREYKHKPAHFYTTQYDAVFVEDLNVRGMLESPQNAQNKAALSWPDFITILKHHSEKNCCHVVDIVPRDTTNECAACGVSTEKPLLVREPLCPSCGFELDRNWNVSLNVLFWGLSKLGVVHFEPTPVETATAVDTWPVSASRVVETGSSALKEATTVTE